MLTVERIMYRKLSKVKSENHIQNDKTGKGWVMFQISWIADEDENRLAGESISKRNSLRAKKVTKFYYIAGSFSP